MSKTEIDHIDVDVKIEELGTIQNYRIVTKVIKTNTNIMVRERERERETHTDSQRDR